MNSSSCGIDMQQFIMQWHNQATFQASDKIIFIERDSRNRIEQPIRN